MNSNHERIAFVLPGTMRAPLGGFKMVYIYSNYLVSHGCDVTLISFCGNQCIPLKQLHLPEWIRKSICVWAAKIYPRWFELDRRINKQCLFEINDEILGGFNHIVATSVYTAGPVAALKKTNILKHYFIQDYETWALPERDVLNTYKYGMSNIVVSDWLKKLVWDESGVEPHLIKNPIDPNVFYPDNGIERRHNEIACLYNESAHKGFADLFDALKLVKQELPDLVVNAFGAPKRPSWMPEWFHYTRSATEKELRTIYSRSTVYACATVNEGFGLTLPESMFCGCALASTRFKGVWEYAKEDCAMLSPIHDPQALAANIIAMLDNIDETTKIANLGREYAMAQCSMERAHHELLEEFGLT